MYSIFIKLLDAEHDFQVQKGLKLWKWVLQRVLQRVLQSKAVPLLMFHQTALVGEDLSTVLAAKWFLPRVDLHVCLQVGRLVEGFAALHAAVGFLARVHINVLLQVALI